MEDEIPRVKLNGELGVMDNAEVTREMLEGLWAMSMADSARDQDYDSSIAVEDVGRLRANCFKTLGRLAVALRPIRTEIPSFDELNLPGGIFQSWMSRRSGLVLVTGPTGSGKSTTLAASLQWANENQGRHIVTIEDPIEYLFSNANCFFSQREVRRDTESFATALRAALRQSPDIILVGEIRDPETAGIALRAAETGHLVLSTLHSSGVADTLERLGNILEAQSHITGTAEMLAHQLIGVCSQQLLPTLQDGVIPVCEYFENSGATRPYIAERRHAEIADHIARSGDAHCRTFLDSLVSAVNSGQIDANVARSAATRPQDFDRALRGIR